MQAPAVVPTRDVHGVRGRDHVARVHGSRHVHTFTVVRQYGARPFRDELPYVIAMVDLEEGPRVFGSITDCDVDTVEIGMAVEVHFVKAADEIGIPYWRPTSH